jgi:4-hydroxybenzoate polyprenyltransferase
MRTGKKRKQENCPVRDGVPLCVDLDGTLIRTDLLIESFFVSLKHNAWFLFAAPVWLFRGKAFLKRRLAGRADLDCSGLPYHPELLEYLRAQRAGGRSLVLVTASDRKYAEQVAAHVGLFDAVLASDGEVNLAGKAKRDCLGRQFGERGFDYAGNGRDDLPVFSHARRALLVNPEAGVRSAAEKVTEIEKVFDSPKDRVRTWIRALRFHQWLKNLLIFVPITVAHQLDDATLLWHAAVAFFAFSLCASSVYLLNDLLDLSADRAHPRKRLRPFAAGALPLAQGIALIPVLLAAAVAIALLLRIEFIGVLAVYYVTTTAYSLWLKGKVMVDVFALAGLYTLRVIAGSVAVGIPPSFWLLAFSMFIFLSLAIIKRYSELYGLQELKRQEIEGRAYHVTDLPVLGNLGGASGYMAVLVLMLYINSEDVRLLYTRPEVLWMLCPVLLYWVSRMWQRAGRGEMHDDPLVFAVKDRISRILGLVIVVVLVAAS